MNIFKKQSRIERERSQKTVVGKIKFFLREYTSWLFLIPSLILFIVFRWQPLITGVYMSFFETKGYKIQKFIGLQNYIDVMSNSSFQQTLFNTFTYVFWSLIIGFLFPLIVAIIINEIVHIKGFFKLSVYMPNMIPMVAAALLWYFIYDPSPGGLLNTIITRLGFSPSQWLQNPSLTILLIIVMATWKGFGGAAIIYLASLQGVNEQLYEAASIDGAGIWQRMRNITIPQIAPIIGIMLIRQVIGVFQMFQQPLVMTDGGPNSASMTLMLQSYFYAFRYFQVDKSLAIGVITFMILMVLTAIYFKINRSTG